MALEAGNKQYDAVISTPLFGARLGLVFADGVLVKLDFVDEKVALVSAKQPAHKKVVQQLQTYFTQSAAQLDVDVVFQGSSFQKRVWQAMCKIPLGKTLTYGDLAKQLGTSARAVGNACRTNKIPIVIPCHRIVAKTGLGGYMGHRKGVELDIKEWLLQHEQALNAR